ncbi:DUF262 domain-containing protein [Bacillus haynesii]|uniref:DUF262 domain-containing protein n=1 Tax=Bacillus haynesii TaxID=1925021 RepID=UPI0022831448|nr:DUF262 domain-containing protein [Bacillus haynesii]MCY8009856.1 DUF262 domain-containing protein [Bacillus haynesii]
MTFKRYNRKTTGITVSIFYEQYQLSKYNFTPPYQRDFNVWEDKQKSFLIDTIMKNFPVPPIFLEQKINTSSGKTNYDVIDGKQRLTAIIDFIENKVRLPKDFGDDQYGSEILNNKSFEEIQRASIENPELSDFVSNFWSYVISVEYIENPDTKVVDNIFDRLNRGGERLNEQELRKANYYDSIMYKDIDSLKNDLFISTTLSKLKSHRLEDISFITEIYLLIVLNRIIDGTEAQIDKQFAQLVDTIDKDTSEKVVNEFHKIKSVVEKFNLDYDKYKIRGTSHLYAIWYLAYFICKNKLAINDSFLTKLHKFYADLRGDRTLSYTEEYQKSMQSGSKYKSSRKKRIMALLDYFDYSYNEEDL